MAQKAVIESLQWEINHLDAENWKLRGSNLERSQFIDLESELALAKELGRDYNLIRGVSRIFIIGFPTSCVGRYFNRGGEATSAKPWQLE